MFLKNQVNKADLMQHVTLIFPIERITRLMNCYLEA